VEAALKKKNDKAFFTRYMEQNGKGKRRGAGIICRCSVRMFREKGLQKKGGVSQGKRQRTGKKKRKKKKTKKERREYVLKKGKTQARE